MTRAEWLEQVAKGLIKPRPPAWWIEQQKSEGRVGSTAFAIWHMNYKPARKMVIWDQAPEHDYREFGYPIR